MNSATSFTQTLTGELADSQRRFLALVATGANPKAINPLAAPQSNGLGGGEMVMSDNLFGLVHFHRGTIRVYRETNFVECFDDQIILLLTFSRL